MHAPAAERGIRAALRRTWNPFFSRFGRLTEIQIRTIPEILEGRNVVVISPAASGKTEAVVAPAVERLLPERRGRFSVLYVSPTRALVNDLYRRLVEPLQYLELALARKTGDHPSIEESKLPFMLITTPESFDSLLCRHTRVFKELSAVMLDELHLLDNTPRGDQLRVLLERLRLINTDIRYYALSATIDDIDIGRRYFPDPVVVQVPGRRVIEEELMPMGDGWPERVVGELQRRECRKVLCFFNARSYAEEYAKLLDRPPFTGRVWVHHASLTREAREDVEATMNREKTGLLCCTSTLELGIDIGDIDAVVLVRPPFNVSSLLQRLGRGNRRRRTNLVALGLYINSWERFLFETMFECARDGRLYEKKYTPALSVIPQQVSSYLFQRRRIGTTSDSVRRILRPLVGDDAPIDRAFRQMIDAGEVVAGRVGIYFGGPANEQRVETGKVHSNIQDKTFGNYDVFDITTGRQVGTIFFMFHHFVLAGRSWELVEHREKEKKVMVRPLAAVSSNTKVFEGTGAGGYSYRLAPVLKARLFPGLEPDQFPYFRDGGQLLLVHLLGSTYGYVLSEALSAQGSDTSDMDGKLFVVSEDKPGARLKSFPTPALTAVRDVISGSLLRLEDSLGSGAFFRSLPEELQIEDHLLALDIRGLLEFLGGLEPVELPADEVVAQIRQHLGDQVHV
ncbi:DEAD/DEAH box helicase [candidate division WOR-3 bacterium]|nr:DEAD/DEAH box helicase [candidate division WOR-3 bacterium]